MKKREASVDLNAQFVDRLNLKDEACSAFWQTSGIPQKMMT
jgi:hypothetical protein